MNIIEILVSTLDTSLPLVSMGFGMYGAMNDTKPKDGKLTTQGKIAISGIVIAGVFTLLIKIGGLYQKVEKQEQERKAAIATADSLRRKDSAEQVFKAGLDKSLRSSARTIARLSKQTDTSLGRLQQLAGSQKTLVTNSIRIIQPLQPLKLSVSYRLTTEIPAVRNYFDKLNSERESWFPGGRPGMIVSASPQNRNEPSWAEIRNVSHAYFPSFAEMHSGFGYFITALPKQPLAFLTFPCFKIRSSPDDLLKHPELINAENNITVRIDFIAKQVTVTYTTDKFTTFDDESKSIFSIYDLAGKYLTVLGSFQKGCYLNDVSFYTGSRYWHLTRLTFKAAERLRYPDRPGTFYYVHRIAGNEIK